MLSRSESVCRQHPPRERLEAFEYGTLPVEKALEVEAHLAECAACCAVLAELPDDGFMNRLRDAYQTAPPAPDGNFFSTPLPSTLAQPSGPSTDSTKEEPALPGFDDLRELGRGGMGVVYEATHALMGRRVAVKVLHPAFADHPVAAERFRREVHAAARLTHPNIVTAHDAGACGERLFLVMELVEGESLAERLRRLGRLGVAEACDAVRQAALGVQHAHDNGLVHRDLKPHNLIRTPEGVVKVCDFGLAALTDDRGRASLATAPNAVMGTPDYIAPEQAEDARRADSRADVYSLGCTLYHLLTGEVPFPEESILLKLLAHRTHERPSAARLRPEVSRELDTILSQAMARRREDRPSTPAELAEKLAPFADPNHVPRGRRRRALLALMAFTLLTAVAAAGVVRLPAGKDREVVIETDDPDVEVVARGDRIVRIIDPKTGKSYHLDRKDLTLSLADDPDGLTVTLDGKSPLVLRRKGKRLATVRLVAKANTGECGAPRSSRLFNGKDLTGWVVDRGRRGAWRAEDGQLVVTSTGYPESGFLLTERSYSDFYLRFEFQLSRGANSGVALRALPGETEAADRSIPRHVEVQILDDGKYRKPDGTIPWATGSLYWATGNGHLRPDQLADLEPVGSWNEMAIECRGAALQVWVNGRRVLSTDLKKLANQSDALPGLKRSSGRIGFQRHTGTVRFRNIEIRELSSPEKESTAKGFLDPACWQGLKECWSITDGVIKGVSGPDRLAFNTFLCSRKKYKDFELQFKVRVTGKGWAGNSGVQIRSTLVNADRFIVRGPQCDIGGDWWGSLYGELCGGMMKRASWEIGKRDVKAAAFNDYFIRCVGKRVTIRVNGRTTVDDEFERLPEEGILAWQLHGGEPMTVTFKEIVFRELGERFKPLLKRESLSGWTVEGDERGFRLEEGVLRATSPDWKSRRYLLSERQYRDYRLRFECRLEKGANSGVVVRGYRGERSNFERPGAIDHPIIKLTDAGACPRLTPGSSHWVASGSHDGPAPRKIPFPVGQWNAVEIEVRGTTCQVWVNNARVIRLSLDEGRRSGQLLAGLARARGHVGFQANAGTACFRNVEIQELPSEE